MKWMKKKIPPLFYFPTIPLCWAIRVKAYPRGK